MNRRIIFFLAAFFISFCSYAQVDVNLTLYGNPNDSTLIKKKAQFEAEGYTVTIEPNATDDEVEQSSGDRNFIKRHTNASLPSFELKDINGKPLSSEDLKGKWIHINFWSVTCKPCIEEFPELNKLKKKYEEKNFVFLAIAPESLQKVNKVLAKHPLDYRVIANAEDFFKQLGIEGYPKNFFINPQGTIVKVTDGSKYKGEMNEEGEMVMRPNNFKAYDEAMQSMQ